MYRDLPARFAFVVVLLFCRATLAATSPDLHKVGFSDSMHGVVLATSDTESMVLLTSDGGKNWIVTYRTAKFLRTLAWANRFHGWIGGNEGVLLETSDGGLSWKPIPSGTERNINALFYEESTLYVAGDNGVLLISRTPGTNWLNVHLGNTRDLVALTRGGTRLFAVSRASISFSDDMGSTWDGFPSYRWDGLVDGVFFSPTQGVLSGGVVLLTDDAGKSVTLAKLPFGGNARRVFIENSTSLFLIAGSAETGSIAERSPEKLTSTSAILASDDRGRTWKSVWTTRGRTAQTGWLEDMTSMGDGKLMAVGLAGLVSTSSDGGSTWSACYLRRAGSGGFRCKAN